jgi:hypothetical protein
VKIAEIATPKVAKVAEILAIHLIHRMIVEIAAAEEEIAVENNLIYGRIIRKESILPISNN